MGTENEYNSYKALIAKSSQACELCDQKFDNRFSSIVHNSSHIIIPLLKQQLYCELCYINFTSTNDFNTHMSEKHRPPSVKLEKLQFKGGNTFRVKEEVEGDFEGDEYVWSSEDDTLLEVVQRESDKKFMQDEFEIKNEEEYSDFINSQLKFEVDDDYSGLLKDITRDCEVDIKYTWNNDKNNFNGNTNISNSIVYEEPVDEFLLENVPPDVPLKADEEYQSVHYSELMTFGFFCCKYCYKYFSNRFSLIVHETTHMRIDKDRRKNLLCPQCDMYIAGNYRTVQKHEAAVHGTIRPNKRELRTCATCGLRYRNYTSHIKNYHSKMCEPPEGSKKTVKGLVENVQGPVRVPIQVPIQKSVQEPIEIAKPILIGVPVQMPILMQELLKESIQMPVEVLLHESDQEPVQVPLQEAVLEPIQEPVQKPLPKGDWIEKFFTIKVCDLCFSFFRSSFKKVYILKGSFRYNTERPCDECKNLFFKLKTVKTIIRIHKSQMNRSSARNTNKERLKKIQIRLKMINKLGKFYGDLLLIFLTIATCTYMYVYV